jgi:rhodanese-related sulfurtransferase
MTIATVTPQEAITRRATGPFTLIDVRTPAEYREIHAEGATLMPLDQFEPCSLAKGAPIFLICKTGDRSRKAAEKARASGREDVIVVEGGTTAWEEAGLPVLRGKKTMPLERQVRIGAGLLVLSSVGLGCFVHPGFYGLSAFVGAGLTFAGISGWCGMGMLLARAPWNR